MKAEKISANQTIVLFTLFLSGTVIVMNPAAQSGEDAWFEYLVGWIGGYIVFLIIAAIASLHPHKSLVDILIFCFGKVAGKIIGFFYGLFFIWLSAAVLQTFGYYEISVNFPETPIIFISICYMALIAFMVKIGLEAIGRICEIAFIIVFVIIIISFLSFITNFELDAFKPVLKNGIKKPLAEGLKLALFPFGESIAALTILPNLNEQKKVFKVANLSTFFAGLILTVVMFRNIATVGVDAASRIIFTSEKIFRLMPGVDLYPLLHIDTILVCVIKVSVALYASVRTMAEVFSLKNYKIFVLPFAVLIVCLSMLLNKNIFQMLFVASNLVPVAYIPVLLVMPIIMLIISLVRTKQNPSGLRGNM